MRLVFGPDDLEAYAAVRDRLRLQVVAWARRHGRPVDPALVAAALDHKLGVDGRLSLWTREHVAEALGVWFPRTVALRADERAAVPAALHAVIGFLAAHGWLVASSDSPADLHEQVEASTPALFDALDDERNHDLGTFWAVQMLRHGVPAADPPAVARFLRRVAAGELPIDRAALRAILEREERASAHAPARPLPPVVLPGAAELLAAADSSVALARLRGFTRWVRAGRELTREGRLHLADARAAAEVLDVDHFSRHRARTADELAEVTLVFHWARQARLVRVVRGRLVQVRGAAPLLSRPIELWRRAFEAMGFLGEHVGDSDVFGAPSLFGMSLGEAVPLLLEQLYAAAGALVPLEAFHHAARERVNERLGCVVDDLAGDVEQRLWRRDVTALLDALELLGAVHLEECHDGDEHAALVAIAGRDDPDPTLVALTPIGLWAVREKLHDDGRHAPLAGELAGEDIEYVCVRCQRLRRDVAEAELSAWAAARSRRAAAQEVLRYLQRADDPTHRELALVALSRANEPAQVTDPAPRGGRRAAGAHASLECDARARR